MSPKKVWGHWFICKRSNQWHVFRAGSISSWWRFPTGAEALAAFAKGDPHERLLH